MSEQCSGGGGGGVGVGGGGGGGVGVGVGGGGVCFVVFLRVCRYLYSISV